MTVRIFLQGPLTPERQIVNVAYKIVRNTAYTTPAPRHTQQQWHSDTAQDTTYISQVSFEAQMLQIRMGARGKACRTEARTVTQAPQQIFTGFLDAVGHGKLSIRHMRSKCSGRRRPLQ